MYSEEELIDELQRVAEELGRSPTCNEMYENGEISGMTYVNRFGSWNAALRKANLRPVYTNIKYTDEDLLKIVRYIAEELGRTPSRRHMDQLDVPSVNTYRDHFGSWNNALDKAGLRLNSISNNPSEGELLTALESVVETYGRVPSMREMKREDAPAPRTYVRFFGSWNEAIRALGYEPYKAPNCKDGESQPVIKEYGDNWDERRKLARERDNYRCQATGCGKHESELGQEHHVHHITPRRNFCDEEGNLDYEEANRLENLVTLCPSCHAKLEGQYTSLTTSEFKETIQAEV